MKFRPNQKTPMTSEESSETFILDLSELEKNLLSDDVSERSLADPSQKEIDRASKVFYVHRVALDLEQTILGDLRTIIRPLTDNLVGIRENLHKVKGKTQELQNSFRSDSEGFGKTVGRFSEESGEIEKYAKGMEQTVSQGEKNQTEITRQLLSVSEASERIQDIAERIKLLSINASVVAARVGNHGQEFKIIAQEVRRLAEDTETSSKQIKGFISKTLENSNLLFDRFVAQLREKSQQIRKILGATVDLESFFRNFQFLVEHIFHDFDDFSGQLELDLEKISPTLQKNEIAMQQIENTGKSVRANLDQIFADATFRTVDPGTDDLRLLLETFSKHLTTRMEEHVVGTWMLRAGLTKSLESPQDSEGEILLF